MSGMFSYGNNTWPHAFNQPIGKWDVGNVTNMANMLSRGVFNQDISKWNTSKVTDMTGMFTSSTKFSYSIGKWNFGNVAAGNMGMGLNTTAFGTNYIKTSILLQDFSNNPTFTNKNNTLGGSGMPLGSYLNNTQTANAVTVINSRNNLINATAITPTASILTTSGYSSSDLLTIGYVATDLLALNLTNTQLASGGLAIYEMGATIPMFISYGYNFDNLFKSNITYSYITSYIYGNSGTFLSNILKMNFIANRTYDLGNIMNNKSTSTFNFPSNDITIKKQTITFNRPVTIKTNDIVGTMDGYAKVGDQVFTFGIRNPQTQIVIIGGTGGGNALAYSGDTVNVYPLGYSSYTEGLSAAWNGTKWVAGTNNRYLYSYDGLSWIQTPGQIIHSVGCNGLAWNGTQWISVGQGAGNTIGYSYDGINWLGLGRGIFSSSGRGSGIVWNGQQWLALGSGGNTIAYSIDGTTWTGLGTSIFTTAGNQACWNGSIYIATGQGTNSLAYSTNGTSWTGLGTSVFTVNGNGIASNGKIISRQAKVEIR
jgi:hypothetical protein